jgi:hypothetical protein
MSIRFLPRLDYEINSSLTPEQITNLLQCEFNILDNRTALAKLFSRFEESTFIGNETEFRIDTEFYILKNIVVEVVVTGEILFLAKNSTNIRIQSDGFSTMALFYYWTMIFLSIVYLLQHFMPLLKIRLAWVPMGFSFFSL